MLLKEGLEIVETKTGIPVVQKKKTEKKPEEKPLHILDRAVIAIKEAFKNREFEIKKVGDEGDTELYHITIRYPEFVITNSSKAKQTIKNLFFRFSIVDSEKWDIEEDFDEGDGWDEDDREDEIRYKLARFSGLRTTFTKPEVTNDYAHSHLSGIYSTFEDFCLGTNTLSYMIASGAIYLDEGNDLVAKFKSLLLNADELLYWESLEGTPYRYIRENRRSEDQQIITERTRCSIDQSLIDNYVTMLKENSKHIAFRINDNSIQAGISDEFLKAMGNNTGTHPVLKGHDGNFYNQTSSTNIRDRINRINNIRLNFNGDIYTGIVEDEKTSKETYNDKYPHPYFLKYFRKKIISIVTNELQKAHPAKFLEI